MARSEHSVVLAKRLTIFQGGDPVLSNVSFSIEKGEFVYLLGRTGSGKSSLLRVLYADLDTYEGGAMVAGYSLPSLSRRRVPHLRRKIGIVFQDFQLLYDRSIQENLSFVMRATGWRDSYAIKKRISELLIHVGLVTADTKMPHQLSGGEQQRLCVARALINEPLILFADEPTGNLDPEVASEIHDLFVEINRSGTAVLMATHNHSFVKRNKFRFLRCKDGLLRDSRKDRISP